MIEKTLYELINEILTTSPIIMDQIEKALESQRSLISKEIENQ